MADRCVVCKLRRDELEGNEASEGELLKYSVQHTDGVELGFVFLCTWCAPALALVLFKKHPSQLPVEQSSNLVSKR